MFPTLSQEAVSLIINQGLIRLPFSLDISLYANISPLKHCRGPWKKASGEQGRVKRFISE